ncbi:MAG: sigma-70 family RNA polymerase sigma factor [Verrucomicrobiaceae bacterium]|nr:MAG: sigma-70 family RNA polymerase sigma factor [Verrucomicrobiaceae bacterium]
METDAELLHRFVTASDEPAFRQLVERHAGMVHGVALRSVGDAAMAEEITQAVLTIFARKARSLSQRNLSGWLHDAAVLEARNFSRKAARYRNALAAYQNEMTSSTENNQWDSISPHLDEAISRLPERAKNLVVMRFHERRSFREIAAASGKSEDASRKEVDRSVQQLGVLLRKRGIFTTGAALSAILAAQNLCVQPASAAAMATAVLQSLPVSGLSVAERAVNWLRETSAVRKNVVIAAVALSPAVYLWAKNAGLEQQNRELRQTLILERQSVVYVPEKAAPQAPPIQPPQSPPKPEHNFAKAAADAREKAALELTRISLNVPALTEKQKAEMESVFAARAEEKAVAKMQAFESGAVRRYAENPDSLTAEDQEILSTMESPKIAAAEDERIKGILSAEQFAEYVKTEEAKRVSDAENAASDVLKAAAVSLDLNPAQKDRIFESLAQLELAGPALTREERKRLFAENDAKEEARDRIVLAQLTSEQAEVYSRFRAERKARFNQFLKTFGSRENAK